MCLYNFKLIYFPLYAELFPQSEERQPHAGNPPFQVALLGHSQMPSSLHCPIPQVNIDVYRRGGAKIDNVYVPPLNGVFNRPYDLIIVFLGGNDLSNHPPSEVKHKLLELLQLLLDHHTRKLCFCLLEER